MCCRRRESAGSTENVSALLAPAAVLAVSVKDCGLLPLRVGVSCRTAVSVVELTTATLLMVASELCVVRFSGDVKFDPVMVTVTLAPG